MPLALVSDGFYDQLTRAIQVGDHYLYLYQRTSAGVILGMKIEFDELFSFLRGRSPLPFFYGIDCRLYENRTATYHLSGFHLTVGQNRDFQLDGSSDLHFFR